jgi:hypothetical protein
VVCEISSVTISKAICLIRIYKRQSYLTIQYNLTRKTPDCKLNLTISRKNADGFQTILDFKRLDICKFLQNINNPLIPSLLKESLQFMKNTGNIFDACDIIGQVDIKNLTLKDMKIIEIFPPGHYQVLVKIFDEKDDKIGYVTVLSKVDKK